MQINGEELLITLGSFQEGMSLFKAVARALKGNKIDLPENVTADVTGNQIGSILDLILSVISDDEIESCLFECAKRCVIGKGRDKIDREYFDKAENRPKYIPVMLEVAKANLSPFTQGLTSNLPADAGTTIRSILKQKLNIQKKK